MKIDVILTDKGGNKVKMSFVDKNAILQWIQEIEERWTARDIYNEIMRKQNPPKIK